MLTQNDINDFVFVTRQDDAFIILQKSLSQEEDRHDWSVIKSGFELSREYTSLKNARDFCLELLSLLGVKLHYQDSGLSLAIEVVKDSKPKKTTKSDLV